MNKSEKINFIINVLEDLFPKIEIPLDHKDPYTLLVAVMLSAQTTDKKVNQVTPKLFKYADTPEKMANLEIDFIKNLIQEIGLAPTKAKNLNKMAKQIIKGGGVKADWDYLENLAGVGHKTASVVMAQAFNIPAFPVDTHIHRLAKRWGLTKGKNVEMTEKDLKKLWPKDMWNKRHLQIIFFGREYCPARNHKLHLCKICSWAASKKMIKEETKS